MISKIITADPVLFSILRLDSKIKSGEFEFVELKTNDGFNYDVTSLGKDDEYRFFFGNSNFHNHSRILLFSSVLNLGIRPSSFVSDRALVAENASVGLATVVYPNVIIDEGVKIGFNAVVMPNAVVGKGAKIANNVHIGGGALIGANATIAANAYIADNVRVGDKVKIGKNVVIKDPIQVTDDIPDGMIIDSYLGEYVRIFS